MFTLKKIVSRLLFPLPLSLEILFVGLYLLRFTRKQRAGKSLVCFGTLLLTGLSYFFTANMLLRPLERRFPPFLVTSNAAVPTPTPHLIVVLGGGANNDPEVPISSRLSSGQTVRLAEGLRLHREFPGSKLILSGDAATAERMSEVAQTLGVGPQDILVAAGSRDTEEEARRIAPLVGQSPFILVTSAAHMPRAMGLFRKLGTAPLAAPTDYLAPNQGLGPDDLFPNPNELFKSQTAVYEYLGLAWAALRGKI
jgi:uncharacterized SAM-binding protein YcdF (DUF218 family)